MPRGRSLRSIHFIWFLTIWVTVENSSNCVFVLISMLGRVKKSHYSSCFSLISSCGLFVGVAYSSYGSSEEAATTQSLTTISAHVHCNMICDVSFSVLSPYAFSICDTTGPTFQPHQYGGIAQQVKPSSTISTFVSVLSYVVRDCFSWKRKTKMDKDIISEKDTSS